MFHRQSPKKNKNSAKHISNKIKSICDEKRIDFDYESLSPSDYAIKTGKVTKEELRLWLSQSIIIP